MYSDSDSDYVDIGDNNDNNAANQEDVTGDIQRRFNADGKRVRGADIAWADLFTFANAEDYKNSDIAKTIKEEFTLRKGIREYQYADVLSYICKYSRRVGYLPCPWMLKVSFFSNSSNVLVEATEGVDGHKHEEDPEYAAAPGTMFRWLKLLLTLSLLE